MSTARKVIMAYGYTLEATYSDGYIHNELVLHDQSAFDPHRNVFHDICNRLPEPEHGRLVRFSALNDGSRPSADGKCYDQHIDFRDFPANAKPIYFRKMERKLTVSGQFIGDPYATAHFLGFEYHNPDGSKVKEIVEL